MGSRGRAARGRVDVRLDVRTHPGRRTCAERGMRAHGARRLLRRRLRPAPWKQDLQASSEKPAHCHGKFLEMKLYQKSIGYALEEV